MSKFDNDREVLVGDLFAKADKGSGNAFLRYGLVLGFTENQIIVQMADLPKPSKVYDLEKALFLTPEFIPQAWRKAKLGFKPDA